MNWLSYLVLSFMISAFFCGFFVKFKYTKSSNLFRIGGVAIILSFLVVLFFSEVVITGDLLAIILGSSFILFFGLIDDWKDLDWRKQLSFQIFLSLILIFCGFEINLISFNGHELLVFKSLEIEIFRGLFLGMSSLIIVFWLLTIINAVNWLDGSDGLLSISAILSLLAIFFISLRPEVNQPSLSIVSLIAVGSFAGFLIFNFPPAKIEAGTSGSFFSGFLLASLAIIAGTKIATTMVVLILPVTDFIFVILGRLKDGTSIFKRDDKNRHLHYKLMRRGFTPKQILFGYTLFLSLSLSASFLVVNQTQKILLLVLEFFMIMVFILSLSLRNEKEKTN